MKRNLVRIGQFARLLGCDPQTLRRLDKLGLFVPRRNLAGHRLFDAEEDGAAVRALRATIKPGRKPKDPTAVPRRRKKRLAALDRSGVGSVPASPSLAGVCPRCGASTSPRLAGAELWE